MKKSNHQFLKAKNFPQKIMVGGGELKAIFCHLVPKEKNNLHPLSGGGNFFLITFISCSGDSLCHLFLVAILVTHFNQSSPSKQIKILVTHFNQSSPSNEIKILDKLLVKLGG